MKLITLYQNTKPNGEDFIITPALFGVWYNGGHVFAMGIGIVWGWHSVCITLVKGAPKDYPNFRNITKNGTSI